MILLDNAGVLYLPRSFTYVRHLSKYSMCTVDICISLSVNVISKDKILPSNIWLQPSKRIVCPAHSSKVMR